MIGQLNIDNNDAYTKYGLYLAPSAMKSLVQWPKMKSIITNEWAEYDGEEVYLPSQQPDARQVSLSFCIANARKADQLLIDLSDGAYHSFRFNDIGGSVFRFRLTNMQSIQVARSLGKLTLTFSDDDPIFLNKQYAETPVNAIPVQGVMIDDGGIMVDVSRYGARVLQGTADTFRKWAQVRENLKLNYSTRSGIDYDDEQVHFRPKDSTVKLLMHAAPGDFWNNYSRLFQAFSKSFETQPQEGTIYLTSLNRAYHCYYKQQTVQEFEVSADGRIWCKFDVMLRLIEWPNVATDYAISTEQSMQFTTTTQNDDLMQPE